MILTNADLSLLMFLDRKMEDDVDIYEAFKDAKNAIVPRKPGNMFNTATDPLFSPKRVAAVLRQFMHEVNLYREKKGLLSRARRSEYVVPKEDRRALVFIENREVLQGMLNSAKRSLQLA